LAGIDPTVGSRAGLTFDHPNMAGNYFLISFFVVLLARHPRNPLLRAAALAVLLLAIAFTGSNAALIGLVLGCAVAGFLSVWRRIDLVGAVAAVAAAAVLGATFTYFANNYDLVDKAEASANSILRASVGRGAKSALGRKELFTDALLLYRTGTLLGRGPSSTDLSLQASQSGLIHEAHNDYLATLVERGPLGMVGLLLLVGGVYVRAMSISLRPLRPAFSKVVPGTAPLLGALVAFAASAMTHEILHYRHLWALLGVLAALYYFGRPEKPSSARGVAALTPIAASSGGELPWRSVEGRRGSTWSGVASPHAGSGGER
jgi:O-antigen ligase